MTDIRCVIPSERPSDLVELDEAAGAINTLRPLTNSLDSRKERLAMNATQGLFGDTRLPQSFWDLVAVDEVSGCWLWHGKIDQKGYGRFVSGLGNGGVRTHRHLYQVLVRQFPSHLSIDHLCRVRACCNPNHLEPVTSRENTLRGVGPSARNARKTHCPNGHIFNASNTRLYAGKRYCRVCHSEYIRERRESDPTYRKREARRNSAMYYAKKYGLSKPAGITWADFADRIGVGNAK